MLILEPDGRLVHYPVPRRSIWTTCKAAWARWRWWGAPFENKHVLDERCLYAQHKRNEA